MTIWWKFNSRIIGHWATWNVRVSYNRPNSKSLLHTLNYFGQGERTPLYPPPLLSTTSGAFVTRQRFPSSARGCLKETQSGTPEGGRAGPCSEGRTVKRHTPQPGLPGHLSWTHSPSQNGSGKGGRVLALQHSPAQQRAKRQEQPQHPGTWLSPSCGSAHTGRAW